MENNEKIVQWNTGLRIRHMAHSIAFSNNKKYEIILGLCATVASALVGTTVFASFLESDNKNMIILAGCFSILATILTTANTYLKFGETAEKHNQALAAFGSLRREFEVNFVLDPHKNPNPEKLNEFSQKWAEQEKTAPAFSQKLYNECYRRVHGKKPA